MRHSREIRGRTNARTPSLSRAVVAVALVLSVASSAFALNGYVLYKRRSTNGQNLIFETGTLYTMTIGGSSPGTQIDSNVLWANYSPDRSKITYFRKDGSAWKLVVCNYNGSGKQIKVNLSGKPSWHSGCWRKADSIVFSYDSYGGGNKILAANPNTGAVSTLYTGSGKIRGPACDTSRTKFVARFDAGVGTLSLSNGSVNTVPQGGCSQWISPNGSKFTHNLWESGKEHQTMNIWNWNRTKYRYYDISSSGNAWNMQRWSHNSEDWIIYPIGTYPQLVGGSNCWAHNIQTEQKIKLTNGWSSGKVDYPCDLWVGTITTPNQPPSVSITSPSNNATYTAPATFTITASASDTDGSVTKVAFYNGGTKIGEDTSSPYTLNSVDTPAGSYSVTAKATDDDGATTTSSAVNITVNAPANQAPSVSITSPANNATYTAPATFTITASASDSDGSVTKVAFYNGGTKIGEDTSSPYTLTSPNTPAGSYALTAKATDDDGATKTSSTVNVTVNAPANQAPSVSITSPANNATFTAPASITIQANASDADGSVTKVEFFRGATKLGEDTSSPYQYTWSNVAAGSYSLTARAIDNGGAAKTSTAVAVTVTPGSVTLPLKLDCGPNAASGWSDESPFATDGSEYTFSDQPDTTGVANAAPASVYRTCRHYDHSYSIPVPNGTYTVRLHFYDQGTGRAMDYTIEGQKVLDDFQPPANVATVMDFTVTVADGNGLQIAAAKDGGNDAFESGIEVFVPAPNQPPSVSITSPSNNATYTAPATFTITASASDADGSVAKVEFYNGGTKIGEDTSSPYTLDSVDTPAGSYSLTAKATDDDGATDTSSAVNITVLPGAVTLPLKLDCGPTVTSGWSDESPYATDGNEYTFGTQPDTSGVANAAPASVYKTCRHQDHSYSVPVPDGTYTVRLHFYDEYGSGRAMDYVIEGQKVLDDFSPPVDAATVREFVVAVSDGNGLQIAASKDGGNDVFECGIEVLAGGVTDTTTPTIAIAAPADGSSVSETVDVTGTASDDVGVATVEIWMDAEAPLGATGTSNWSAGLDTTLVVDGAHTISACATDAAGNSKTVTIDVYVDNGWVAPNNTILSPAGGEVWYIGTTHRIEWRSQIVDNVTILYSTTGGAGNWQAVGDGACMLGDADWQSVAWVVPDEPTTDCVINIAGYFGDAPADSASFEIRSVADGDGDGMDDAWETQTFGDLTHDGSTDADGDGVTDADEFLNGTDPLTADGSIETLAFSCAAEPERTRGAARAAASAALLLSVVVALSRARRHPVHARRTAHCGKTR